MSFEKKKQANCIEMAIFAKVSFMKNFPIPNSRNIYQWRLQIGIFRNFRPTKRVLS